MRRFALAGASVATAARSPLPGATEARPLCAGGPLVSVEGIAQLADCIMKKWVHRHPCETALEDLMLPNGGMPR